VCTVTHERNVFEVAPLLDPGPERHADEGGHREQGGEDAERAHGVVDRKEWRRERVAEGFKLTPLN
jgi:hypothetical protein